MRVPNALFRDWLTKHYSAVMDEALAETKLPPEAERMLRTFFQDAATFMINHG